MKFGIIVPTYNRALILPRAIRSVLEQDYPDWALYVVNDGSTDETEFVVAPYLADSRVRYLDNHANRGTLHSLNHALDSIEADRIDWFTWMDDDDQLTTDCLSIVRAVIDRHPAFGMFLFRTVDRSGNSLARMEVSGPANYLREKLLRKTVAGETHEFVAVPHLNGTRLGAPSTGAQKFWFGELSLRTGAVFCNQPTKIKEFLEDGITLQSRRQGRRAQDEREARLETYLLRHWVSVVRRHPLSFSSYMVWGKGASQAGVAKTEAPIQNDPR